MGDLGYPFPPAPITTTGPSGCSVFYSLVDTSAGLASLQIQIGLWMTSLPSPISSVINIWLCFISHKDNMGGGGGAEIFPPSCRQTEGTLNYARELRHVITDNLRLFGH